MRIYAPPCERVRGTRLLRHLDELDVLAQQGVDQGGEVDDLVVGGGGDTVPDLTYLTYGRVYGGPE